MKEFVLNVSEKNLAAFIGRKWLADGSARGEHFSVCNRESNPPIFFVSKAVRLLRWILFHM